MAPLITPEALERERRKHQRPPNTAMHEQEYGVSGWKWADDIMCLANAIGAENILDYGAGRGTLAKEIGQDIKAQNYDPVTFPCNPDPADIVVCTDVLEQIDLESLDPCLDHIKSLARKAVFIVIPKHPKRKAENAIRAGEDWWLERLSPRWPSHYSEWLERRTAALKPRTPRLRFIGYV